MKQKKKNTTNAQIFNELHSKKTRHKLLIIKELNRIYSTDYFLNSTCLLEYQTVLFVFLESDCI